MADQNLPMSDEITTLCGHFVWPIFVAFDYIIDYIIDFLIRYSFECTFVFMSDQIFILSDQNGALFGHMSFQGKKIICSPDSRPLKTLTFRRNRKRFELSGAENKWPIRRATVLWWWLAIQLTMEMGKSCKCLANHFYGLKKLSKWHFKKFIFFKEVCRTLSFLNAKKEECSTASKQIRCFGLHGTVFLTGHFLANVHGLSYGG